MSRPLRITLAVSLGLALLVPATGGAQDPPPEELAPPAPTTPADPAETVAPPSGPSELTIKVPPLPEKKAAAPKAAPKKPAPARTEPVRRAGPRRSAPVSEPSSDASEPFVPEAETAPAEPKTKPKHGAQRKKVQRPKPRVVAKAAPPTRTIRDRESAGAVLAARFTLADTSQGDGAAAALLVLALVLAGLLGVALGLVGAAPLLADRWPKVFDPVIEASERIVLAGVCLAGAALTLVITWALTGPGA